MQSAGPDLFLGGVIPKPRVFFSGARDLARIATPSGIKLLLSTWGTEKVILTESPAFMKNHTQTLSIGKNDKIKLSAANKGNINFSLHRESCSFTYSNMI